MTETTPPLLSAHPVRGSNLALICQVIEEKKHLYRERTQQKIHTIPTGTNETLVLTLMGWMRPGLE